MKWQIGYEEAQPVPLPKGTRIECTAHHDNSVNNPANPNPNATVRWGDQTWEEMMMGFFSLVVLSLIHISEPTRLGMISYAVFCL